MLTNCELSAGVIDCEDILSIFKRPADASGYDYDLEEAITQVRDKTYMHVCMYVCMYMHVCMYEDVLSIFKRPADASGYGYDLEEAITQVRDKHMCVCVYVCTYACVCMHVCVNTYMYTYIHTYIHTYICIEGRLKLRFIFRLRRSHA
jgi:hypothetical protein